MAHPQIEFLHNTVVEEVLGVEEKDVHGLKLMNRKTGEQWELPVQFMFLGIGHEPNADLFKGQIDLDDGRLCEDEAQRVHNPAGCAVAWRVCLRRRSGQALSPGNHRCRFRLHGCTRGRKVP